MAKFITGKDLEKAVYDIIWDAEETLLIVCPYIRLDSYFKTLFKKHIANPKVHIVIVFGKNPKNIGKSFAKEDFEFFKTFTKVSIIYVPHLHAKYYGNESKGVITSINLHDHSFKNNIEFGVYSEINLLDTFRTTAEKNAWNTCWDIASNNEVIFVKRPIYEKTLLSVLAGKKYIKSEILYDITENYYQNYAVEYNLGKRIDDFPEDINPSAKNTIRPERETNEHQKIGFCIRTGIEIPFNIKKPFCEQAYRTWAQFKNDDYPEKYCHKTGRQSYGKTSLKKPILDSW